MMDRTRWSGFGVMVLAAAVGVVLGRTLVALVEGSGPGWAMLWSVWGGGVVWLALYVRRQREAERWAASIAEVERRLAGAVDAVDDLAQLRERQEVRWAADVDRLAHRLGAEMWARAWAEGERDRALRSLGVALEHYGVQAARADAAEQAEVERALGVDGKAHGLDSVLWNGGTR